MRVDKLTNSVSLRLIIHHVQNPNHDDVLNILNKRHTENLTRV